MVSGLGSGSRGDDAGDDFVGSPPLDPSILQLSPNAGALPPPPTQQPAPLVSPVDDRPLEAQLAAIIASIASDKLDISGGAHDTQQQHHHHLLLPPRPPGSASDSEADEADDYLDSVMSRHISDQVSRHISDAIGRELALELDAQLEAQLEAQMEEEWRRSFYDSIDAELDRQMDQQLQAMMDGQRPRLSTGDEDAGSDGADAAYWDRQLAAMCERAHDFQDHGDDPYACGETDPFDCCDDLYEHGDASYGGSDGCSSCGSDGCAADTLGDVEALSRHFNQGNGGAGALARLHCLDISSLAGSGAPDTADPFAQRFGAGQQEQLGAGAGWVGDGDGGVAAGTQQLSQRELHQLLDSVYGAAGRPGDAPKEHLGGFMVAGGGEEDGSAQQQQQQQRR